MTWVWGILVAPLAAGTVFGAVAWGRRAWARERLYEGGGNGGSARPQRGLRRWLSRAGVRSPVAPLFFVVAMCASVLVAVLLTVGGLLPGWGRDLESGASLIPGPAGALFGSILVAGPWIMAFAVAAAPWLWVRARRRRRVTGVEADLPITLELLATLSEAGVGFDSAVERVLRSSDASRPLAEELQIFQRDLLAGARRTEALARLSHRVDVGALTGVTSALIQADQIGSGISEVLRTQSEDLRQFRRERALAKAEALEVKLVFPLVLCFLPGLFVAVVGPSFYQFVQLIDGIIRGSSG